MSIETNVYPRHFYTMRYTEQPPPRPVTDGEHLRRFVIGVEGRYEFTTTGRAPEAVEQARKKLEQVFELTGVQLEVSGVRVFQPFE